MLASRPYPAARWLWIAVLTATAAATTVLAAPSAGAPTRQQLDTVTVDTLPIANGFPLDIGIQKGFFEKQGIQIKKQVLQSGNDIVLAMANHNGDIGYIGYVPAMIARTQGIPIQVVAASEVEGTSAEDNWQNVVVRGSSSIRSPADLAGKTVAVNAVKGLAEVVVRGALKKVGVDPNSVKLVAIPFPAMRTALNNGQVDAAHTPEPFLSQILGDGGRIVLAPGPTLGRYWPNGCYVALEDWATKNPGLAKRFRAAINQALAYSQAHPDDIRALLPPALRNIRLPVWSPLVDRGQLLELAKLAKEFGVITTLPNFNKLVPGTILSGQTFQVIVGKATRFTLNGRAVKTVKAGTYNFAVTDRSSTASFRLTGPGVRRSTSVPGTGSVTWTVALKAGTYRYGSGNKLTQSFTVT
jgi:NitT/TauT family transport system substrate-binding protein